MVSISGREKSSSDSTVGESLSALVDNQGNDLDLARVLKASDSDPSVRTQWQRYHQVSAVLRNEDLSYANLDISSQIRSALDGEPALENVNFRAPEARNWLHLLGKTSIAATVAFGFLIGVQQLNQPGVPDAQNTVAESEPLVAPDLNSAVVPAGFDTPQLTARTVSTAPAASHTNIAPHTLIQGVPAKAGEPAIADPELKAHFDRLLMIHAQEVSANSDFSVMPFARLTDLNALDQAAMAGIQNQASQATTTQSEND
ncbi:sigma-E factor negative regulatory protein RseA [Alteromonadaceae bacterium 2753L.S.0a.02]|nr:sigma-E factor negative regulatory protein RseA [Alteromonadaceae bacterium 2753L.S.0a.02]